MNEKYIISLYNQLGGESKFGSFEAFKRVLSTNKDYQKKFHSNFGEDKLGSFDAFSSLVSASQQPEIITPKKKEKSMVSDSEVSSSVLPSGDGSYVKELTEKDEFTQVPFEKRAIPEVPFKQKKPIVPQDRSKLKEFETSQQYDRYGVPITQFPSVPREEYLAAPSQKVEKKVEFEQNKEEFEKQVPGFLKPSVETIDKNFLSRKPSFVVDDLNRQYKDAGFEFTGSDFYETVQVKAPNGKTLNINTNVYTGYVTGINVEDEAERLKFFIKENAASIGAEKIAKLQKDYEQGKQSFLTQKQIDDEAKRLNDEAMAFVDEKNQFLAETDALQALNNRLESYPEAQRNTAEYNTLVNDYNAKVIEYQKKAKDLDAKMQGIADKEGNLKKTAGEYTKFKAQQGGFTGYLWRQATDAMGNIVSGWYEFAVDRKFDILPLSLLLGKENYEFNRKRKMEDLGLDPDKVNLTPNYFDKLSDAEKRYAVLESSRLNKQIDESIRDDYKKIQKYGKLDYKGLGEIKFEGGITSDDIREYFTKTIGTLNTTKEYQQRINEEGTLIQRGLGGFAGSIPAMMGGSFMRIANMYMLNTDAVAKEMQDDPDFKDVSESEKELIKGSIGVVSALLEEIGFRNAIKGKAIIGNITKRVLGRVGTNVTSNALRSSALDVIKEMSLRGGLRVLGGALSEAETGALQQMNEFGVKDIYNAVKGKKMFDTPQTVGEYVGKVLDASATESVGGIVTSIPSAVSSAFEKDGFQGLNDDTFKMFEELSKANDSKKFFVIDLKNKINEGKITKAEADNILANYDKSAGLVQQIPDEITDVNDRKVAMDLLKERKSLEDKIENKDPALAKPIQNKINQINEQLTKLTEDAIQKQAAGEVPVQPKTGVGEEVVQGKPETGLEVTSEQVVLSPEEKERKEDIESRREADLETYKDKLDEQWTVGSEETIGEKINAKYDAELAELEKPKEEVVVPEAEVKKAPLNFAIGGTTDGFSVWNTKEKRPAGIEYKDPRSLRQNENTELTPPESKTKIIGRVETVREGGKVAYYAIASQVQFDGQGEPRSITDSSKRNGEVYVSVSFNESDNVSLEDVQAELISKLTETVDKSVDKNNFSANKNVDLTGISITPTEQTPAEVKTPEQEADLLEELITGKKKEPVMTPQVETMTPEAEVMTPEAKAEEEMIVQPDFTEQDQARKRELEDALKKADKRKKNVMVGEVSMPKTEVKAELDALKQKEQAVVEAEVQSIEKMLSAPEQKDKGKIRQAVTNAAKAIAKILPNTKIVLHETSQDYVNATGDTDNASGLYVPSADGGTIHINLSNANTRTVGHEVFHATLLRGIKTDAEAQRLAKAMIGAVAKSLKQSGANQELLNELENFLSNYDENIQNEEYLAEVFGYLADGYPQLTAPEKSIINRFIERIMKLFGLKPMTDKEVIDFMNTLSRKIATGEEISDSDISKLEKAKTGTFKGGKKVENPSKGLTGRKRYGDDKVNLQVRYIEQERMNELIEKKLVKEVDDLSELNGYAVVTTSPDDMLVGSIYVNGKEVAVGNGGIFFVTKFGDVWANSNEGVTNGLAAAINESYVKNNGKAYLLLVKGTDAKLVSSPQGVTSSLAVVEAMLDAKLFSLSDFEFAIKEAVEKNGGNISLSKNANAIELKKELDSFFSDVTSSTFEKRGNVLKSIISILAKSESAKQNSNRIIKFLNGDISKGIGVGSTPKSQSLVDLIAKVSAEELTKGLSTGDIYGAIEINSKVKVFKDEHQSYPYHIKMIDENGKISSKKPILILPRNRKNGKDILTSLNGETYKDLGTGFAGKVGATANLPFGKGIVQDTELSARQQKVKSEKSSGTTQRSNTVNSYVNAANYIKDITGNVLDYGAGLGLGTDAMSETLGRDVDSYEPNPERWKGRKEATYTSSDQINKKYDAIVSLNVLNVVPKDIRDAIIKDIFDKLNVNGKAIISTRGWVGDVNAAKNAVPGPEEKSLIINLKQDGQDVKVFQKGFDGNELVNYIKSLLGDNVDVVKKTGFGKSGVVITKKSELSLRQQKSKTNQEIIKQARANGYSEAGIRAYFKKNGLSDIEIDELLEGEKGAGKKIELSEETLPGYTKLMNRIKGVISRGRKNGKSDDVIMQGVIANVEANSPEYANATNQQQEQIIRDIRKLFGKKEKAAPSAAKILGKPKPKKVLVDDMAALHDLIRSQDKAGKAAKKDLNTKRKELAEAINKLVAKGTITLRQANAIIKRVNLVNLDNPIMVDRLINYVGNIFNDADYDTKMQEVRKLQNQVKRKNHTSTESTVREFTSINPELIPDNKILQYIQALDDMNTGTPSYAKMNDMFDEVMSYKTEPEGFNAIKTFQKLMDKLESIALNEVKSVEDYVNLIRDINAFKRNARKLLENGSITQKEYDEVIENVGKDQAAVEKKYEKELAELKKNLVSEIEKLRPKTNPDFTAEENAMIEKYLEIGDKNLEQLAPEELYILNDLLQNIKDGQMDYYRFADIVSKAYSKDAIQKTTEQVKKSKFNMALDKGKELLSEYESSFWEGLLGLGRVTSGALQKFIVSPVMRAIASYEKFVQDSYKEFSILKKKYGMNTKEKMNKLGMLTTYLQEYMAQFDPDNEGVKDIGKRDWFKEILNSNKMKEQYPSEKFTARRVLGKLVGGGKTQLESMEKIWNSLPKDKDGNVDPKAVYDSYMANDGKFFSNKEKEFFDKVMEWKQKNTTTKQKAANELRGNPFKEMPFHMLRSRYDSDAKQIAPKASGANGMVRIEAGTGKEIKNKNVGPININFEELFIEGVEQTARDYFLSGAIQDVNNVLSGVSANMGENQTIVNTITGAISEALNFEFEKSSNILGNILSARATMVLLDAERTVRETLAGLVSYPIRAKTISGYKDLFRSVKKMKDLLEFTQSPLRLRENIGSSLEISDGQIQKMNALQRWTFYLAGLPERTMMVTSWMPTFRSEFKNITGSDFNMEAFKTDKAYKEKFGKAIREASAVADAQTEKIIGTTAKAGQRRNIRIAPEFLANLVGLKGTVKKNTAAGQIIGFFTNYPYREVTEFFNGFREAAEIIRNKGFASSPEAAAQLSKPLGIIINVAVYGYLASMSYALQLMALGDDDDEERGKTLFDEMTTTKGILEDFQGNAISLLASRYGIGSKALLQIGGTVAYVMEEDAEKKKMIKKFMKGSIYVDPLPIEKATQYGGKEAVAASIASYIPQLIVLADRLVDASQLIEDASKIYNKAEKDGVDSLTEKQQIQVLVGSALFKGTQLALNFAGTSLPFYGKLKIYEKKLRTEAGIAEKTKSSEKREAYGGFKTIEELEIADPKKYKELSKKGGALYEFRQKEKAQRKVSEEKKAKEYEEKYGVKPKPKKGGSREGTGRDGNRGVDRGSDRGGGR